MENGIFDGFGEPKQNWSKLPHQLVLELPNINSISELKVILYVLRHTWGYHDDFKKITINEFCKGRRTRDGSRIDLGTGLSRPSVVSGIKRAVSNGYLFEYVDSGDAARIKKYYSLNIQGLKTFTSEVKNFNPGGKKLLPRTEKETIERKLKKETKLSVDLVDVFDAWEEFFPGKPKPRRTINQKKKVATRLKESFFRENFRPALARSSKCACLHNESWFQFSFMIKNSENVEKMLDGWMEWKDKPQYQNGNGRVAEKTSIKKLSSLSDSEIDELNKNANAHLLRQNGKV